ncbi:MAG: tight adherence protein [Actinomycetota bacterium]|nr:tight adherence protein [Actinomycetota bacterium]
MDLLPTVGTGPFTVRNLPPSRPTRTDAPELLFFVRPRVLSGAFDGPGENVLRVESRRMRVRRRRRAEEDAQKVPATMVFPLVFCILPCLFIAVIGPAGITMLQNLRVP